MSGYHEKKAKRKRVSGRTALAWLDASQTGADVLATARLLLSIEHSAKQVMPQALAKMCQVARIDRQALTLVVPGAVYAARLRQLAPRIIERLNKDGWNLNEITVKIQADLPKSRIKPSLAKQSIPLDDQALKAFADLRESLEPGPLANAVARLLERHRAS